MNNNDIQNTQATSFFAGSNEKVNTENVPMNCSSPMAVTSINDLNAYARGQIIRLPDFAEGQPFVVRIKRPSMLVLAKSGKIPNTLLTTANELFMNGGQKLDVMKNDMLSEVFEVFECICSTALVEPTYDEIKDAGLTLTDEQMMAIFNYIQQGVKSLENFR